MVLELFSSGVPALDERLGGGYPDKSVILILGEEGSGKERLGYKFIGSGLDNSDYCLYVTRLSTRDAKLDAIANGLKTGKMPSWIASEGGEAKIDMSNLASLSFNIKALVNKNEGRRIRIVLDFLSPSLVLNQPESVYKFLSQLFAEIKQSDAALLGLLDQGMHKAEVVATLEDLFDGVIALNQDVSSPGAAPLISIKKMRGFSLNHASGLPFQWGEDTLALSEPDKNRIAVLPFRNISPDPNDEYFADGLTEELIDRLSQVRDLEVIARTSVMPYKNKEKKAAEIGRELRVGALVEGSVRKAEKRIRVTAQLIEVKTEGHLWSSRYDSELQDIFEVQSDIAEKITEALKLNLIDADKKKIGREATSIPEAYVAYLNGVYFRHKGSLEGVGTAVDYLNKAIELDPRYAEAFAQLAVNYIFLGLFWAEPAAQAFPKAKALAEEALNLNPKNAEAYYAESWVSYIYDMDFGAAEREGMRALELKPSYAEPNVSLVYILIAQGKMEEALKRGRKAVELDPLGVYSYTGLARALLVCGRFEEAILWSSKAIDIEPNSAYFHLELAYAYMYVGNVARGLNEMEKTYHLPEGERYAKPYLGLAYALAGKRDDALKLAKQLELGRAKGLAGPYGIALIYAGLGENQMALDLLEQSYSEKNIMSMAPLNIEPAFKNLRSEPRFRVLLRKMNLGEVNS